MPFQSKRQQRFMYATKPKGVDLDEWAKATNFSKLPERARKKKRKRDKNDLNPQPDIPFAGTDVDNVFQGDESLESHGDKDVDKLLEYASIYNTQVKRAFDLGDLGHLALDLAGLIGGPGELADFANAVWYATEGRYLMAALSLISMIPELGDALAKGTKTLAWLAKTAPDATAIVSKYGPDVVKIIREFRTIIKNSGPIIEKAFEMGEKSERLKPHIPKMREALNVFAMHGSSSPEDD